MFELGWQELIILMLIALIVVGPKDLPRIVKTAGQWMGKARGYARDFQRTIEEAADATEIDAIKKEIDEANRELSTAKRDVNEGANAVKRDVAESTDSMNKMLNEDVVPSSGTAAAKPNGGEPPSAQPAEADGGQAQTAASAAESAPATAQAAPAAPAAETQGDGADGSPARGASA
ncbi:MAG: Sec-independent protein translocase protein TatB [Rhodospirillales bacterium]|nr:Sec-independent protein translocase protein TatB [Rhodospirillales bacterium]MDE0379728.1 Sec-independent protein translocase protein TatB [Rhodospirillales bacterium]